MKYLLVKGYLGFGDRLESLKMCVKFALDNNLKLYVDWRDSIWSHGTESFYTYFALDIPSFTIEEVEGLTVYPPIWKDRLHDSLTTEFVEQHRSELTITLEPRNEDVIVFSSIGTRQLYNDSTFFANVFRVVDPRIIQKVKQRQVKYELSKKFGIHLRGTDRASSSQYKQKRITEMSIKLVSLGALGGLKMVVVSDDPEYIQLWKTRFPDHPILTEVKLEGKGGIHTRKDIPISKDEMNVDMLVDFFTLASCARIMSTSPDSRFSHEAKRLHPHIKRILG